MFDFDFKKVLAICFCGPGCETSRRRSTWVTAVVLALGLNVYPATAAEPPATRVIEGPAIGRADAITELGGSLIHLNSTTAARHAEINTIAVSLRDDVDLIYQYVHDTIETTPAYGLKNGALGALIDGKGTAFDQAHLMVELLRAAGHTAQYRYGKVTLSAAQFQDLFGTSSDREACELLRDGGFGMEVGASIDCPNLSGASATQNVSFNHVWVEVDIEGANYYFDPSIKTQTRLAGWDLGAKMVYNDADFWTKAGVVTGTDGGSANYATSVDTADIETELVGYANELVAKMRLEENHDLSVADIAGGFEIEPAVVPSGGLRQTESQLGYTVDSVDYTWSGDIPNQHRTKVRIDYNDGGFTLYADDLYGRRLWLQKSGTTVNFAVAAKAIFSATFLSTATLSVAIDHPYAASSGTLGDHTESFNPPFQNGTTAALVLTVGPTGPGLQGRYSDSSWQALTTPGGISWLGNDSGAIAQMSIGASWLAQATLLRELSDGVNGVRTTFHDSVGLISGDGVDTVTPMMDIRDQFSLTDPASVGNSRTAAIQTLTSALAALEGAALDQMADTSTATSGAADTLGLFLQANDDVNNRFYDVTSANWSTVQSFLTNYSVGELADLNSFLTSGYRLILPKDGNLTKSGFTGVAYLALKADDRFGHLLDDSVLTDASHIKASVTDEATLEQEIMDRIRENYGTTGSAGSSPRVNPAAIGARTSATDLTVGTGGFPYALSFTRSFRPDAHDGTKGGWTHNFDIKGRLTSDGLLALGNGSAVDAARAMAALYIARETLKGGHTVERIVTGVIIQDWLHRGLYNNIFKITQGHQAVDFVQLADGSFNPSDGEASSFVTSGAGAAMTATFTAKSGIQMVFNAVDADARDFRIDNWTWPSGMNLSFTYPTATQIKVQNDYDRSLTIDMNADGQATKVTDNTGRHVDYTYDASGIDIIDVTLFDDILNTNSQSLLSYTYTGDVLDKISTPVTTDTVSYTHNALDQVTAITSVDAGASQIYKNTWRSETIDPSGASRVTIRDPYGRWVKTIDGLGIDGLGNETLTTFDSLGRVIRVQAPEENAVEFTYDKYHNRLTATNIAKPSSGTCATPSPGYSRLCDETTKFAYEGASSFRQLKTATDPLDNVTTFTYEPITGLLASVKQPAAPVNGGAALEPLTSFAYNAEGQVISITDPELITTTLTYNGSGDLIASIADDGGLNINTTFTYTTIGDLASTQDHRGNATTYGYDMLRRRTSENGPVGTGHSIDYTYDADGRLTDIDLGSGTLVGARAYDARGRVTTITDNALKSSTIAYDDENRSVTVTDPLLRKAKTIFDAAGRRTEVVTGLGSIAETREFITYNPNGTVATVQDGKSNITSYTYDGFDRLIKTTYPDASFEEVTSFDVMGRPLTQKTRNGDTITLTYDAVGRLQSRLVTGGTRYDYEYDIRSQVTRIGQGVTDVDYTYDALGRVLSEIGAHDRAATYTYDDSLGETDIKYNHPGAENDFTVAYFADALNRLSQIDIWQDCATDLDCPPGLSGTRTLASYTYDIVSRTTQKTLNISGVTIGYAYDTAGRLNQAAHDLTETADDVTLDYIRNDAGQVTSKDATNASYIWTPPADSNDNYLANALNQYTSTPLGAPTYDSNGNMTSDGVYTFIYDAENRLTEAKQGGAPVGTYSYDPLGRRSEKTNHTANVTTEYLYSGAQVLAEYNGADGNLERRYVYGPGLDDPIAMLTEDGTVTYFQDDGRGTIIALSDEAGANTDIFTHGPYGELDANTGGSAYKYTARRIDEETGLYYYRNRYYHPEMGRFMSADPIGYGDGLNMYAYVGNDPVNRVDPWGLADCIEFFNGKETVLRCFVDNGMGGGVGGSVNTIGSTPNLGNFDNSGFRTTLNGISSAGSGGGGGGGSGISAGIAASLAALSETVEGLLEEAAICNGDMSFVFSSADNALLAAAIHLLNKQAASGRPNEWAATLITTGGGFGFAAVSEGPDHMTSAFTPFNNMIGFVHLHPNLNNPTLTPGQRRDFTTRDNLTLSYNGPREDSDIRNIRNFLRSSALGRSLDKTFIAGLVNSMGELRKWVGIRNLRGPGTTIADSASNFCS